MTSRRGFVLLGAAACVWLATAVVGEGLASTLALQAVSLVAVGLAWWGATRKLPRDRRPWRLLAAGLTAWAVGDIIWDAYDLANGEAPTLSFADVFYLLAYPLLAAAIVTMIRRRSSIAVRPGVLDGLAIGLAAALATWSFLIPASDSANGVEAIVAFAYPLADVVLLAALVWLILSPGIRGVPSYLLLGGTLLVLALDVAMTVSAIANSPFAAWADNGYCVGYIALAVSAAHQRSGELTLPDPSPEERVQPARLVFLGAAMLTGPVLGTLSPHLGPTRTFVVLSITVAIAAIVLVRFLAAMREVERARRELDVIAGTDSLTGLDNRRRFVERAERLIERSTADGVPVTMLMIDIDHFKTINDTYGHASGDAVLSQFAERLIAATRPTDLVGRLGGDEFAVLLAGSDRAASSVVAERIHRAGTRDPYSLATDATDEMMTATTSIGVAVGRFATLEMAFAAADAALYERKRGGRNGFHLTEIDTAGAPATV